MDTVLNAIQDTIHKMENVNQLTLIVTNTIWEMVLVLLVIKVFSLMLENVNKENKEMKIVNSFLLLIYITAFNAILVI